MAHELDAIKACIAHLDERLKALCWDDETCRRLLTLPGVGPVVATALVASVGDAQQLRSGRELLAAWIGLAPRQRSTGGKRARLRVPPPLSGQVSHDRRRLARFPEAS